MRPTHQPLAVTARQAADDLARRITVPPPASPDQRRHAQSLADGATGIALLHIERAHAGLDTWATAHAWLQAATAGEISAADNASLYAGAPAVAFALHTADTDQFGRYTSARARLDRAVTALTHRRIDTAHARIDRRELPGLAEFDVISGLSGIGAHLLRNAPGDDVLERLLSYLVRLTEPLRIDGETLPGWWTGHDPNFTTSADYPGGHGNFGMAHGICGPLALLALAWRRGITVDQHLDAIERICAWLDIWRQDGDTGPWWPQWISRDNLPTGRASQPGPLRPSWCYGTPGLARAQHLAALATGDTVRQVMAEQALVGCLSDPEQLAHITDTSLCHGWAGLFQTVWRTATDSATTTGALFRPDPTDILLHHARPGPDDGPGLLEGHAGLALAVHTAAHNTPPLSGWDACLLLA
ncbi:lanthionine synthetase C family protein [Protofrankia symbiont of Coriaria ruscifolia]|uniref:lanthionine synthetase C family protein n=1 Tax=Protofrankia symbiont of Coriaria ruscifolia TaxID=1306542 RepID=UPI0010413330|nr:lanthionine synthetase C family protein [Protofrankia symbiont of Coriaria ruscifolia]